MPIDAEANMKTQVHAAVSAAAAEVLGMEPVDMQGNFFELGGSSLSAALMTEQLESRLGVPCPMELLYEHPVLADFADVLRGRQADR
jgi:hypothetical protein